jgi:hypothetical protein
VLLLLVSGAAILKGSQLPAGARFFSKPYNAEQIGSALQQLLAA